MTEVRLPYTAEELLELLEDSKCAIKHPSTKYEIFTLGESLDIYTAPEDGWFYLFFRNGYDSSVSHLPTGRLYCDGVYANSQANQPQTFHVYCKKGEQISVFYNQPKPTRIVFRFYYAEGCEPQE